ncbi:transcriptional regulator, partial [Bacillus toyonensis]
MLNYEKDAEVFKALAHPVRIEILKELIIRGACNV